MIIAASLFSAAVADGTSEPTPLDDVSVIATRVEKPLDELYANNANTPTNDAYTVADCVSAIQSLWVPGQFRPSLCEQYD
jgi:hypothetical protein